MQIRQTYVEWVQSNQLERWYFQRVMLCHGIIMMLLGVSGTWTFLTMMFMSYLSVVDSIYRRTRLILVFLYALSEFDQINWIILSPWLNLIMIRFFLRIPLPWAIQRMAQTYQPSLVFETALVRTWQRIVAEPSQSPWNVQTYRSIYQQIIQGIHDQSEPFSEHWRERFRHNLKQIRHWVILRDDQGTLIIMPSVIIILKLHTFVVLPVQMNIVEKSRPQDQNQDQDEICPICQDKFSRFVAKLNCGHQYCPRCILQWTYVQMKCPLCRAGVNSSPPSNHSNSPNPSLEQAVRWNGNDRFIQIVLNSPNEPIDFDQPD